jgi:cardiolipin synthase
MPNNRRDRWLTIPNAICVFRFLGSFAIIPAVIAERPLIVLSLFVFLAMTDWVDGKLARALDQRSLIGPKLDSAADVAMYAMFLFAVSWLRADVLRSELLWVGAAAVCFAIAIAAALVKFGSLPSYHTRSAKTTWFLMVIAAIALFLDWSVWPLRIALLGVIVTNLESIAITATLSQPYTDVISLAAARRLELKSQEPPE